MVEKAIVGIESNNFVADIENICQARGVEYIDAVIHWCQLHNLEVETAAHWIKKDPAMKSKIRTEAELSRMLKTTSGSRLPV